MDDAPFERQHGKPMSPRDLAQYSILSRIGEGTFANVYRAENVRLPTNSPMRCLAIKRFKPEFLDIGEQEARIMESLLRLHGDSSYSVKFYSGFLKQDSYLILLELLDWTRSLTLVPASPYLSPTLGTVGKLKNPYETLAKLALQLLNGVAEIHDLGYAHCDIKPENIMYVDGNPNSRVKIIDFGNSTKIKELKDYADDFELQSLGYRAPELIMGDPTFNEKIDVWSVGVVLLEILVNYNFKSFEGEWRLILNEGIESILLSITKVIEPFDAYKYRRTLYWRNNFESSALLNTNHLISTSVTMKDLIAKMCESETSKLALDFLLCLLRVDHRLRWPAAKALQHPFLIETLQGTWGKVLFPDRSTLLPGDSQLKDLRLF